MKTAIPLATLIPLPVMLGWIASPSLATVQPDFPQSKVHFEATKRIGGIGFTSYNKLVLQDSSLQRMGTISHPVYCSTKVEKAVHADSFGLRVDQRALVDVQYSYGSSNFSLPFRVETPGRYRLAGSMAAFGSARLDFRVVLRQADSILFEAHSISKNTASPVFNLAIAGGDSLSLRKGALEGDLEPNRTYTLEVVSALHGTEATLQNVTGSGQIALGIVTESATPILSREARAPAFMALEDWRRPTLAWRGRGYNLLGQAAAERGLR